MKKMSKAPARMMPKPPLPKGGKKVSTGSKSMMRDKKIKDIEDQMGDKTF